MTKPVVLTEVVDSTFVITLNRPSVRNAVNGEVSDLVGEALESAEHDDSIRAVIITGNGDKAFCSGADLKAVSKGESINAVGHEKWSFGGYVNHPISKPTIAAVNGAAIGGGMEIVLASDLVVSADHALFGLPEARRGVVAGGGGALRLPRRIPPIVAMEMLLTGSIISAERALELHLVNYVVKQEALLTTALNLANEIARGAPLSIKAHKKIALGLDDEGHAHSEKELWQISREAVLRARQSEDFREGALAFVEKRKPNWAGR